MKKKIEFETFRDLDDSYILNLLKQDKPSNVNFLEYRKYKVTIELIEEPKDVLIERLKTLLDERSFNKRERVLKEIERLSNE